ncbi:MAG: tetratricopeptide repeat protein [Spirulina sp. SIO3F2]|nr:tetratricopeptide repeat protein [Spirulina sp. SIO3F2]
MIVKDEELLLPQCLDSAKDVVDEIVIVDTGSSDRTVEIAEAAGAVVGHFEWCDDFAAARNAALEKVTGDWVLILDADEELNPKVAPKLRAVMVEDNLLMVNLIRQELGAVQSPYSMTSRLFRNHKALRFDRPYHALIDDSVEALIKTESHWEIGALTDVAVLHYGYAASTIAAKDKQKRAQAAMEQYLDTHPDDPYVCSKLGALYMQMGKQKSGLELLERGLKTPNLEPPLAYELHYHLANAYQKKHDGDNAVIHYQSAIAQNIVPALKLGALNNFGALLYQAGEYEMAQRPLLAAVQTDANFVMGYYNLGMAFKATGNYKDAITAYEKAIALQPDYAPAYQNLGVVWFKCGKVKEALDYFGKAIAILETQNLLEAERLRREIKEMGFETPNFDVTFE